MIYRETEIEVESINKMIGIITWQEEEERKPKLC